jgi:GAF domain-containing protein
LEFAGLSVFSFQEGMQVSGTEEKRGLYADAEAKIRGLIAAEPDRIARMAGIVAVLHRLMPHYFWTGFYRVSGGSLVIGPYQGTPGCARIAWGRGVCGTAWATGESQVVPDVHAFPGHIACDSRSESEIVVPVRDARGTIVAVFDVDSESPAAFDEVDRVALERIFSDWGEC